MNQSAVDLERLKRAEMVLVAPGHVLCESCSRPGRRVYHKPGQHQNEPRLNHPLPEVDDQNDAL